MDRARTVARMEGVYLAIPTFFNEDFSLNLEGQRRHIRFLLDGGVSEGNTVLLVAGAAGEFPCLTTSERLEVAEAVLGEANGEVAIIVGAQTTNQLEAIEIAKGAEKLGADAIQISPPFYFDHSPDDVYEFVSGIAASVDLGVVVYPTPWTAADMSMDLITRIVDEVPNIVSLKMATAEAWMFQAVIHRFRDRVCVVDNQLCPLTAYLSGARGFNVHVTNYWPEYGINLMSLLKDGKYEEAQDEYLRVVIPYSELGGKIMKTTGGEGILDKLCCELVGLDSSPSRPPTREVRDLFRDSVRTMLEKTETPRLK